MPRKLRIGSVQYNVRRIKSAEDFYAQVMGVLTAAQDYRCDLLVFPEYFTVQLLSLIEASDSTHRDLLQIAQMESRFKEFFSAKAQKMGLNIVAGTIPVKRGEDLRNASFVFSANGNVDSQEKLHMTRFEKEEWLVKGGDALKVFEFGFGKIAINICYDIEFPELGRAAAQAGAEIIVCPSCTDDRRGWYRVRACAAARAIENQVYVVQSSTVGTLAGVPAAHLNYGQSGILCPSDHLFARDGVVAEGVVCEESFVFADVDLDWLTETRTNGTVLTLRDSENSRALANTILQRKLS
jgi:predicted amidohydrolase